MGLQESRERSPHPAMEYIRDTKDIGILKARSHYRHFSGGGSEEVVVFVVVVEKSLRWCVENEKWFENK